MGTKSANLYVRIEPDVKEQANVKLFWFHGKCVTAVRIDFEQIFDRMD